MIPSIFIRNVRVVEDSVTKTRCVIYTQPYFGRLLHASRMSLHGVLTKEHGYARDQDVRDQGSAKTNSLQLHSSQSKLRLSLADTLRMLNKFYIPGTNLWLVLRTSGTLGSIIESVSQVDDDCHVIIHRRNTFSVAAWSTLQDTNVDANSFHSMTMYQWT